MGKLVHALVAAIVAAAFSAAAASTAHAGAPVAESLSSGFSFQAYAGGGTVGNGGVAINDTLFFIDEKTIDGLKSWLIFFDPAERQSVSASLRFSLPITSVSTIRGELIATSAFESDSVTYAYRPMSGLERSDSVLWLPGGTMLDLAWTADSPGDHIRVLTAVPEPGTFAMLGAGLGIVGWIARRRRLA